MVAKITVVVAVAQTRAIIVDAAMHATVVAVAITLAVAIIVATVAFTMRIMQDNTVFMATRVDALVIVLLIKLARTA